MRPAAETRSRSAPSEQYAGECPRCGAPFADDQEYCLECGLRLPPARGPRTSLDPERRFRRHPGSWFWPAVAFLLLAAAGAAGAILLSDRSKAAETLVATAPPGRTRAVLVPTGAPPATRSATLPAPPLGSSSTVPTTTAAAPPPPPPKQTKPIGWPAGQRGYTVVLASIPATRGRDAAVDQARRAIGAGLTGVGILDSSSFSSLHPGYFVIFTGVRDSEAATARDLTAAQTGGYARAYVRQITP